MFSLWPASAWPQLHKGGPPTSELRLIESERDDFWMLRQNRMDHGLQITDAFAVDDPDLKDSTLLTFRQVIGHKTLYFTRLKRVQIEHAINGKLDRFVHLRNSILSPGFVSNSKHRDDAVRPLQLRKILILAQTNLSWRINTRIRVANIKDVPVIADFNARLALETEGRRLDIDVVQAGVRALLDDSSRGTYFVAETQSAPAIAGQLLITYEWSDWRNGNFWWIQSVYVAARFRKHGIFRALFHHIHELAKS